MRTLVSAGAACAAVVLTSVVPSVAFASTAPGDNGTVKIHDARTGEELKKNEPHVCTFYLDAFGFDGGQQVDWKIVEWPPTGTKGKLADSGAITLDASGHGRTADQSLADGHYKLTWNFDGENGDAKQKVFWVDCSAQGGGTGGSPSPSASATQPAGSSAGSSAGGGGAGASAAPSASPSQGGNLAETGAQTGAWVSAAAVLLAAGGGLTLVVRRRAAARR
jgi:LPXTG-motif cell wall-anchored protein